MADAARHRLAHRAGGAGADLHRHRAGGRRYPGRPLRRGAARPHRRASLHAGPRHPADPRPDRGADHLAVLLFEQARRRLAGLRRLCPAGARAARPVRRRRARQDPARGLRPAAVHRRRGPRGRLRAPGGAAQRSGRGGVFRPRRHQLDRRPADRRLLQPRARALPRIRSDPAGPRAGVSQAYGRRGDEPAADRCRSDGRGAWPRRRADADHRPAASGRRRAVGAADRRDYPGRLSTSCCWCIRKS